eukprot:TRINITY_DN17305_c0_g1_i1.p1 TRINITY_DN17305_c0_g1~~TRINITY_DN17305_c0_g1_i1.p1  ORF type:complete len:379 (+),score=101.82 TRINITY_DN17305_c0_g1_i1:298-1434(+)
MANWQPPAGSGDQDLYGYQQQAQLFVPYIPPDFQQQAGRQQADTHFFPAPRQLQENPFARSLDGARAQLSSNFDRHLKAGLAAGARSSSVDVTNTHLNFSIFCAGFKDRVLDRSLDHVVKAKDVMLVLLRAKGSGNNMEAFRYHYTQNRQVFNVVAKDLQEDQQANDRFKNLCVEMTDKAKADKHEIDVRLKDTLKEARKQKGRSTLYNRVENTLTAGGSITTGATGAFAALAGMGVAVAGVSAAILADAAGGCGAFSLIFAVLAIVMLSKKRAARKLNEAKLREADEFREVLGQMEPLIEALMAFEGLMNDLRVELQRLMIEVAKFDTPREHEIDVSMLRLMMDQSALIYHDFSNFHAAATLAKRSIEEALEECQLY